MNTFTIGRVSELTGLPEKTIRFYEDEGILSPVNRQENGYRSYSPDVVEELKLLKHARDLGLPLAEIKKLMKGCEDGNCRHSEAFIKESIASYLVMLDRKISQMTELKSKLQQLQGSLPHDGSCKPDKFCCDILHQLVRYARRKGGGKTCVTNAEAADAAK